MDSMELYWQQLSKSAVDYIPNIILAIITLIIGLWIAKGIAKAFGRVLQKRELDVSLSRFLESFVGIILKVVVFISVASVLGVETTSFVAILGAAGLAIGLALQGSLSNFAGGVLILMFRPFQVGDYIDANGESGTVEKIMIFNTVLKTPDNKIIIMPNGPLSNSNITNYSAEETRRVDMVFGIGYDDDIKKARDVLGSIIAGNELILKDPEPAILVSELADSSVNFAVRVWTKTSDYWSVYFAMQETVKVQFDANNISIPYPQQDVHMHNASA